MSNNIIKSLVVAAISFCVSISARRFYPGGFHDVPQSETFNFTCPSANEKPKITFAEDKWSGDGNSPKYTTLVLDCVAAFPIYWEFIPPKGSQYTMKSKISVHSKDFKNGDGTCYKEELRIESSVEDFVGRSGNYTCKSASEEKTSNSVFVFTQDTDRIFAGLRDYIETPSRLVDGKEWLIPCSANLKEKYFAKDLGTKIEVKSPNSTNTTEESLIMYPGDPSVRYDSKLGFLLSATKHSRPKGIYICGAVVNSSLIPNVNIASTDVVIANMTDYNVFPPGEYVQYTNYKQIKVVCESDEDIYIDISKSYLLKQETADPKRDGHEGEITCKTKISGRVLQRWKHDVRKACNATIIVLDDIYPKAYYDKYSVSESNLVISNNVDGEISMVVQSSSCETKAQCDLAFQYFDHLSSRVTEYVSYGSSNDVSLLIRSSSRVLHCVADHNYVTMIMAVAGVKEFKINPTNWSLEHKINVSTLSKSDGIFVGDSFSVLCKASKYFYNDGLKWEFVYKNGSRTIVDSYNDTETDHWGAVGTIMKASTFAITDKDVTSVACYAHLWNSTLWESEKIDISHIEDKPIWNESAPLKCDGGSHNTQKPTIVMQRNPSGGYYIQGRYGQQYVSGGIGVHLASHFVTNSEIVIQYGIESFYLYCIAAYPVKWVYADIDYGHLRGLGQLGNLESGTETPKNDTINHCFQRVIQGYAYSPDQTGEYRCEKINDKKIFSYAYIYVNTSQGGLINRGEHMSLTIDDSNSTILVPCKVSDPTVVVELYYHEDEGHYRKVNNLLYDPKKGFLLEISSLNTSSIYICTTANRTDLADALSFTFQKKISAPPLVAPVTAATNTTSKSFNFFEFFFMVFLIVTVISLQLWFLRKQFKLDHALSRIFGSYINMGSELTPNEFDRYSNGNTQLIPGLI